MTKVNIRLRILPRVFRMNNDGKSHILEIHADTRRDTVEVLMDGIVQENDAVVKLK